ncbi:N-acetylmuramoyl-L-alanine amidase [Flavobacterium procerum]|uniref:N-acetylmuramoyl-L-alanine amidase n=1 Tax=Flavobacterium procerum TaxID=1455569 RepID=A0ABV6BRA6_9FLAO
MNKKFIMLLCGLFFIINGRGQDKNSIDIIKKPITYNEERIKLSLEYLKDRHGLIQTIPTISPKIIVLHYTAGGTLKSNFNYFNNTKIEESRNYNKNQSQLNVSAHYLIDRDGKIYQLIDDTLFARHTIGLNYCSIGIENIGSKTEPLTEAQIVSNSKLIRHLKAKFNIEYVIGHNEYGKFRKTKLWKETNPAYFTGKEDPGIIFLQKVRNNIKDLNLKYEP